MCAEPRSCTEPRHVHDGPGDANPRQIPQNGGGMTTYVGTGATRARWSESSNPNPASANVRVGLSGARTPGDAETEILSGPGTPNHAAQKSSSVATVIVEGALSDTRSASTPVRRYSLPRQVKVDPVPTRRFAAGSVHTRLKYTASGWEIDAVAAVSVASARVMTATSSVATPCDAACAGVCGCATSVESIRTRWGNRHRRRRSIEFWHPKEALGR